MVVCLDRSRSCADVSRSVGSGACIAHQRCQENTAQKHGGGSYLSGLLRGSRLALRERRRRGFLSLFGRLSLRREDHQRIVFTNYASLNSRETTKLLFSKLVAQAIVITVSVRSEDFTSSSGKSGLICHRHFCPGPVRCRGRL